MPEPAAKVCELGTWTAARDSIPSQDAALVRLRSRSQSTSARQLACIVGALGVTLIGQANELSVAYLDNARLFSPLVFGLCGIALLLGIRLNPRPGIGLPFGLLTTALVYTLAVGAVVAAPVSSLDPIWFDADRIVRALVPLVCAFIGVQTLLRGGGIGKLATMFTWVAAAVVSYQVVSFFLGHQPSIRETVEAEYLRYSGIFGNPNQASSFCSLLMCLCFLAPLSGKVKVLVGVLAFLGIVVTHSRGGFVTFSAVMALNVLIGSVRSRIAFSVAIGAAAATVLLAVPLVVQVGALPSGMSARALEFYELITGQTGIADNSRGLLVVESLRLIEAHPISGLGLGSYYAALGEGSHNMYTHIAMLAGIPAVVLYTAAIATLGWSGLLLRDQSERRFVVSVAAWMAVMGLSSHNLLDEKYSVLLVSMACAIVAVRLAPIGPDRANDDETLLVMKPQP